MSVLPASGQDFRRGLQSYNHGDYSGARDEWQPLAERGDADAQAGLAYLYLKGLGVRQNTTAARDWYARSAEQGYPGAQFILGTMYFYGDGIERDFVLAYAVVRAGAGERRTRGAGMPSGGRAPSDRGASRGIPAVRDRLVRPPPLGGKALTGWNFGPRPIEDFR